MLTKDEVESLTLEMRVTSSEMPILNAMAKLRLSLDEVRDGILLVRKFNEWHRRNNYPYPLLKKVNPAWADTYWFAIQWWWDEYSNVRKKIPDPKPENLFTCFRNYKPDA